MASNMTQADRAAQLARDLEIVRRGRSAPVDGITARVISVKEAWPSGILHQRATVETDRGQAVIETMASVYRSARHADIDPGSIIIADWARGAARFVKSIGWVRVGDTITIAQQ